MKYILLILLALLFIAPASANPHWDTSYSAYITITMDAVTPETNYQMNFTDADFTIPLAMWNELSHNGSDTRILNYNHTIEFPFYVNHLTARDDFEVWVNVTDNASAIYHWYFGKPTAITASNGTDTFIFFDDFSDDLAKWNVTGSPTIVNGRLQFSANDKINSTAMFEDPIIMDAKIASPTNIRNIIGFHDLDIHGDGQDRATFHPWEGGALDTDTRRDGTSTNVNREAAYDASKELYRITLVNDSYTLFSWADMTKSAAHTTNVPNETMYIIMDSYDSTSYLDSVWLRKYTDTIPGFSSVSSVKFYAATLHYNAASPYNFTIDTNGNLTSNRSITPADDTGWTAKSTGTTNWVFDSGVNPTTNTQFTTTGSDLNEFSVTGLTINTEYTIFVTAVIDTFTTDGSGEETYTTNLDPKSYLIFPSSYDNSPVVTSLTNNISTNIYPKVEKGNSILFTVAMTSILSPTYIWYVDDVLQVNNYDNLTVNWTSTGTKNVTVWVTNAYGTSNELFNYPISTRAMASSADVHALYSEEGSEMLMESIDTDEPDIQLFFLGSAHPYMIIIGSAFFLILYGLPMILIWISTKKALIPVGLTMIFGVIFLGSIPGMFVGPAILFSVITCVGIIYSLAKER